MRCLTAIASKTNSATVTTGTFGRWDVVTGRWARYRVRRQEAQSEQTGAES
jgi:hypothetical protein